MAAVQDVNDFHSVRADAVDQQIIGVNHCLARCGNAAGAVEKRVIYKALRAGLNSRIQIKRGRSVPIGDVACNAPQIGLR